MFDEILAFMKEHKTALIVAAVIVIALIVVTRKGTALPNPTVVTQP